MTTPGTIHSLEDFLSHALAIEREAAARYRQFADQMLVHNNPETARLFERLAQLESEHHERLQAGACAAATTGMKPWEYAWVDPESPESAPLDAVHYLMSPYHALQVALANEVRALHFFEAVAESPGVPEAARVLAREFAADERDHATHIERALARTEVPAEEWGFDPDPPIVVD